MAQWESPQINDDTMFWVCDWDKFNHLQGPFFGDVGLRKAKRIARGYGSEPTPEWHKNNAPVACVTIVDDGEEFVHYNPRFKK